MDLFVLWCYTQFDRDKLNNMLNTFRPKSNCEEEAKFLQERINLTERNLASLCDVFGQYARKTARLRDKGDELAKTVLNYSNNETLNKSLATGLENFAESMSTLSDYGDARTQALEHKVVRELSRYEDVCRKAKEEVKDVFGARERELQRKKQLDRIRDRNPRNRQQIQQAETELVKATAELSKTVHNIEDKASTFERQKLHDVKGILLDFISVEMGYHAKALETLSSAFQLVHVIDEDSDLEEFKKSLRLPSGSIRRSPGHKNSIFRSTQSLGSLGGIFSTTNNKLSAPGRSRDKINKSEDTLDSLKRDIVTDDDDSSQTDEESEDNVTEDDDTDEESDVKEASPVAARVSGKKRVGKSDY